MTSSLDPHTTYLPPENKYQRLGLNATFRQLPWDSTLAARYTWSETESSADLTGVSGF